jgi:hypothetical protein
MVHRHRRKAREPLRIGPCKIDCLALCRRDPTLEASLTAALRSAGVRLVPTTLQRALEHLLDVSELRRARRPHPFPASLFP